MEKAIIGKKVGMTQIFDESGHVIPRLCQINPLKVRLDIVICVVHIFCQHLPQLVHPVLSLRGKTGGTAAAGPGRAAESAHAGGTGGAAAIEDDSGDIGSGWHFAVTCRQQPEAGPTAGTADRA